MIDDTVCLQQQEQQQQQQQQQQQMIKLKNKIKDKTTCSSNIAEKNG